MSSIDDTPNLLFLANGYELFPGKEYARVGYDRVDNGHALLVGKHWIDFKELSKFADDLSMGCREV